MGQVILMIFEIACGAAGGMIVVLVYNAIDRKPPRSEPSETWMEIVRRNDARIAAIELEGQSWRTDIAVSDLSKAIADGAIRNMPECGFRWLKAGDRIEPSDQFDAGSGRWFATNMAGQRFDPKTMRRHRRLLEDVVTGCGCVPPPFGFNITYGSPVPSEMGDVDW